VSSVVTTGLLHTAAVSADSTRLLLDAEMDIVLAECPQNLPFYSLARHALRQLLATESRWLLTDPKPSKPGHIAPHRSRATICLRSGLQASIQSLTPVAAFAAPAAPLNGSVPANVFTEQYARIALCQTPAHTPFCPLGEVGSHPLTDIGSEEGGTQQALHSKAGTTHVSRACSGTLPQRCPRRTASGISRYGYSSVQDIAFEEGYDAQCLRSYQH
jgi:hypothetical protein